jgi:hypothetical protein
MTARLIKRVGYSSTVRDRLDDSRPKYSEAVKSIAAFCNKNTMTKACLQVLLLRLDDAVAEARTLPRLVRVQKLFQHLK